MANKTIKGITIALGADFSAVGKAVDGIDKKFRSMQTELRQVDKLLKLDPKNTELLTQKQDLLAQSIQGTRDRLTALQSAQEKVNKAFQEGKIDESQYRAYQREIAATEQTLKNLERQEKETADAIEHANDKVKASAKEVEAAKDSIKKVGDDIENVAEKAGKGLLTIGTAVAGAGTYCLNFSTDFDKALNNVITKTGATAQETAGLEEVMESVYSNNFGEDIADVGNSVATVKQQMKLAGEELQATTENALLLRDTFDFEVNESTRAAKMLMDQFDISAKEAFTLIAQGAQNGLDKNGDLLDTINEYSVHFKQAGFDAESMFNMLINGTESGTFSVDKLGDTVKEFFIRAKDGSDSTIGAFQKLGLNANKMTKKFAEGGTSAYEAYQTVNEALFNLNDTVKQNEIGVALYGTMWEDLGADGVQALTNIDGAADQAANTLEQINKTQYDDLGSSLETLGRTMNTEIIRPLGDKLTPYVKDLAEEIKDHAPEIKDLVMDAAGGAKELISYVLDNKETVITTIGGVAAALAAAKIAKTISGIISGVKNLGTAVKGLFTIISANPIGAAITAVGLLVGGIIAYTESTADAKSESELFAEETKKLIDNAKEQKQAWDDLKEAQKEKAEQDTAEIDHIQTLWAELQTLVDENGNVLDANKERVKFLVDELQPVLGDAIQWNEDETVSINDTAEAIDNLIAKRRAEIILMSEQEAYEEALKEYKELQNQQTKDSIAIEKQAEKVYMMQHNLSKYKISDVESEMQALENMSTAYETNEGLLQSYYQTIQQYESDYAAIHSGNYEEIEKINSRIGGSFQTATTATKEELKEQAEFWQTQADQMQQRYEKNWAGIDQKMVEDAQEKARLAWDEYYKVGGESSDGQVEGYNAKGGERQESTQKSIDDMDALLATVTLTGPTIGEIKYQEAVEKAKKDINDEFSLFHLNDPILVPPGWNPFNSTSQGRSSQYSIKQNAKGGVFNRETLIGYTVGEAGREAILPLNRQVYSEIGEGVLRSVREKSLREITEPIRRMWEEDSIRVNAAYAATAAPPSPVNKVQAPVINQTNNITAPTPLSPYETARQVKIASQSLAWR